MRAGMLSFPWRLCPAALVCARLGYAVAPFTFLPPSLPIAVKSPYLNAWTPEGGSTPKNVGRTWEEMWNYLTVTAWQIAIRVDDIPYSLVGDDAFNITLSANLQSTSFTPTQTLFSSTAGGVLVNVTFLSPVNPTDLTRQSLPFTYATVTAKSNDGQSHSVQIYSDITAQWLSTSLTPITRWNTSTHSGAVIHEIQLEDQTPFTDIDGFAQGANLYFAMAPMETETWQIGSTTLTRGNFNISGALPNTTDPDFRVIGPATFPGFAFAADLGEINPSSTPTPVVFTIGLITDPAIQYVSSGGQQTTRSSYFWSNFSTALDAASFVIEDYNDAVSAANNLDGKLFNASQNVEGGGDNYPGLVAVALRQALASLEVTVGKSSDGAVNASDVMVFQKNFDSATINDVNIAYSTFPSLLYLNPDLAGYLLVPLLEYQSDNSQWPFPYATRNLGTYPNATGSPQSHDMGVEESASMLIMVLAHAQIAHDLSLITAYYPLLSKWGDYLVNGSQALSPGLQSGPYPTASSATNQTNVALKGIIGVAAMAKMSNIMGKAGDAQRFQESATSFLQQWITLAVPSDNSSIYASYGQTSSTALMSALFADQLTQLHFIPTSVYEAQVNALSTIPQSNFGVVLDTNNGTFSSFDETMLLAAALTSNSSTTATSLVDTIFDYVVSGVNQRTLFTEYNTITGVAISGVNSGAVGSIFAHLALSVSQDITPPPKNEDAHSRSSPIGAIVGGVVGGVALILIGALVIFYLLRRGRRQREQGQIDPLPAPTTQMVQDTRPMVLGEIRSFAPPANMPSPSPRPEKRKPISNESSQAPDPAIPGGPWIVPSPVQTYASGSRHTAGEANSHSHHSQETSQLRSEVERLRQEIDELRLPPAYEPTGEIDGRIGPR